MGPYFLVVFISAQGEKGTSPHGNVILPGLALVPDENDSIVFFCCLGITESILLHCIGIQKSETLENITRLIWYNIFNCHLYYEHNIWVKNS